MERSQFTFYRSYYEAIKTLPKKEQTAVLIAICGYALDKEEPKLTGTAGAIFTLIRPTLDTGWKKAMGGASGTPSKDNRKTAERQSKDAAKEREKEKEGEIEEEKEEEKEREREDECPPPMPPSPGGTPTCGPQPPGEQPKPVVRHKHGQYGWVQLSDEEYSSLLCSLGETELNRCITYVDESAQSNGNKNRWKDWNLVIRKCHREGWGLKQYGRRSDTGFETGNPFAEMLEEELRKRG